MTGLRVYPRALAVNDLRIPIGIPDDQASRFVFIRADSWMSRPSFVVLHYHQYFMFDFIVHA
jgi:hypothetical protein